MKTKYKTRTLAMVAVMAAILAVLSPLSIPTAPVPFTLGVFAVYLTAAMLPPLSAMASLSVYILLGVIGLPVFSNHRGGPQVLVGPTGGYIVGYFFIVLCVALVCRRTGRYALRMAAAVVGLGLFYLAGTLWYSFVTGSTFVAGLAVCVVPFAIPDLIKAAAALALAGALNRRLEKAL